MGTRSKRLRVNSFFEVVPAGLLEHHFHVRQIPLYLDLLTFSSNLASVQQQTNYHLSRISNLQPCNHHSSRTVTRRKHNMLISASRGILGHALHTSAYFRSRNPAQLWSNTSRSITFCSYMAIAFARMLLRALRSSGLLQTCTSALWTNLSMPSGKRFLSPCTRTHFSQPPFSPARPVLSPLSRSPPFSGCPVLSPPYILSPPTPRPALLSAPPSNTLPMPQGDGDRQSIIVWEDPAESRGQTLESVLAEDDVLLMRE